MGCGTSSLDVASIDDGNNKKDDSSLQLSTPKEVKPILEISVTLLGFFGLSYLVAI